MGRRLALLVVPTLLLLTALELLARVLGPEGAPGAAEALPPRSPGELRVAFYGGSTVQGGHLPELGWVALTERLLAEALPGSALHVLVVDDSPLARKHISRVLTGMEIPAENIDVANDGHMHGLIITLVDDDHLIHQWTMYEKGKEGELTTLKLARVQ